MRKQRRHWGGWIRSAALGAVATATALSYVLWGPVAAASPETDAYDAITAAWEAAGGEESPLGAPQGDVYPVGAGFAGDFAGGKMYFTPETGAHSLSGPVLDKYESLGGAASSDLGFPSIDETPGLAGPGSRFAQFSGGDRPLIFFTPEHGAFVVRGPINTGWDTLGSSSGALGAPAGDETFDGDLITQKFAAGQLSWNRKTKEFITVPPELAAQLAGVHVEVDPTAAINAAWRGAGGATGPLGAKQGDQYPAGDDGVGQDFAGGKIFYTPATGANAVEGEILGKYESLGGPVGSDLGFPVSNPADGGIESASQVSSFSAPDQPVIFWSADHGAFVVRGAMKAAWDKLGGAAGDLGAPVGDQTIDGDLLTQGFVNGRISWNREANSFTTEPAKLAEALSGLAIPGQGTASAPATSAGSADGGGWPWWVIPVAVAVLLLTVLLGLVGMWRWRRHGGPHPEAADHDADYAPARGESARWSIEGDDDAPALGEQYLDLPEPYEADEPSPQARVAWAHRAGAGESRGFALDHDVDDDLVHDLDQGLHQDFQEDFREDFHEDFHEDLHGEDPDEADTAPTGIPVDAGPGSGRHSAIETATRTRQAGVYDDNPAAQPAVHLPLSDPYQAPEGFPIKANTVSGLYYTPDNALYHDTLAEIWFATEAIAQANGFIRAG